MRLPMFRPWCRLAPLLLAACGGGGGDGSANGERYAVSQAWATLLTAHDDQRRGQPTGGAAAAPLTAFAGAEAMYKFATALGQECGGKQQQLVFFAWT